MAAGEERLAGPVGREMKPEPGDAADDAAGDFEQVEAKRPDGRRRQGRAREDGTSEVREQEEREAVQLQAEGVRAKAMTAESIGVDIELELCDPILGRAAVVVPGRKVGGAAATIGDHEAHVEALRGDVDLDENSPGVGPGFRAMPKTRAEVHRAAGAVVPPLRRRDPCGDTALEDGIGADSQHIADAFGLQLRFDGGRRHPGVAAQKDRRVRESPAQGRQDVPQLVDDAGRTRVAPGPQAGSQQESGTAFEPQQRVLHMLVVPPVKERQLLRPVRRVVRAVQIENEIRR